jgi:hypothetical protein
MPRVDFQGAAVFVFQKAAGLDQTPATFLPTFPPRFPLIPKTELLAKIFRAHRPGGESFRAAPAFSPGTIETRGGAEPFEV